MSVREDSERSERTGDSNNEEEEPSNTNVNRSGTRIANQPRDQATGRSTGATNFHSSAEDRNSSNKRNNLGLLSTLAQARMAPSAGDTAASDNQQCLEQPQLRMMHPLPNGYYNVQQPTHPPRGAIPQQLRMIQPQPHLYPYTLPPPPSQSVQSSLGPQPSVVIYSLPPSQRPPPPPTYYYCYNGAGPGGQGGVTMVPAWENTGGSNGGSLFFTSTAPVSSSSYRQHPPHVFQGQPEISLLPHPAIYHHGVYDSHNNNTLRSTSRQQQNPDDYRSASVPASDTVVPPHRIGTRKTRDANVSSAKSSMPSGEESGAAGCESFNRISCQEQHSSASSATDFNQVVTVEVQKRRPYRHESFPEKLFRMLKETTEQGKDHIISWTFCGRAFEIHQPEAFANDILPEYFRHNRLASFRRQLSMYGFKRAQLSSSSRVGAGNGQRSQKGFAHEQFHRDHPEKCSSIKRISEIHLKLHPANNNSNR